MLCDFLLSLKCRYYLLFICNLKAHVYFFNYNAMVSKEVINRNYLGINAIINYSVTSEFYVCGRNLTV